MKNDALLYVGQKAFIEKDGKILVLHDYLGLDFPGGKIQEGEIKDGDFNSLNDSLKREVAEETGFKIEVFDPFAVWYRVFPKIHKYYGESVYLIGFKCKYISGDLKLSDEHDKFEWVDKSSYEKWNDKSGYFTALKKYFLLEK